MLQTLPTTSEPRWQDQLADLVTDPLELLRILELSPEQVGYAEPALRQFPLRVTRPYLARMRRGDPQDPLLLQVLPGAAELEEVAGYTTDPLAEADSNPRAGLLHKYHGRVLLIATQSCAIHCRYCFRRHFPYQDNRPDREQWRETLDYIAADNSISEVILSGGDPLAVSNGYLRRMLDDLSAIPHLRRLRLHTRLPLMLPARVDRDLLEMLNSWPGQVIVVLHANHAREFDSAVDRACRLLRDEGRAQLLNQSVLLRGINDSAEQLTELSERLFAAGILPYYLHMLDKVSGAAHFAVPEQEALALTAQLRHRLPGYLVPRLVLEQAGEASKTPL